MGTSLFQSIEFQGMEKHKIYEYENILATAEQNRDWKGVRCLFQTELYTFSDIDLCFRYAIDKVNLILSFDGNFSELSCRYDHYGV